jgi:thiosulfate reductase cytochrome b subunit
MITPDSPQYVFRHSVAVRVTHWVTAWCALVLLMSGLQIFNAHPALYWGEISTFDSPLLAMTTQENERGVLRGSLTLAGVAFDTTGVLGASVGEARAFPSWSTLPSSHDLATGRRWHFFFAWLFVLNGLLYILTAVLGGHVRRDLVPSRDELRHVRQSVLDHLQLRFPAGDDAKQYNVLQKLAYLIVIFGVLPLIVLTGLTMSPAINAAVPELVVFFGGRQSARTLHFVAACGLLAFVIIHIAMVLLSGASNNIRSMFTGRYAIRTLRSRP